MSDNCSSSCKDRTHNTYGECLRAKSLKVAYAQEHAGKDATAQKAADKNLENYAKARKYGIQPQSTRKADVDRAVRISEQTGSAYQAG